MARVTNQRLDKRQTVEKKKNNDIKETFSDIKSLFCKERMASLIFIGVFSLINIISMIIIGCVITGIPQAILFTALFFIDIVGIIIYTKIKKPQQKIFMSCCAIFMATLCIVSLAFSLYGEFGWNEKIALNKEIRKIEKTCDEVVSTPLGTLYVDMENKKTYTVSDIAGYKYINTSTFSIAEESEYNYLYNVGIQLNKTIPGLSEIFLYPPTPNTTTGYEYILEVEYSGQKYVAKVFIPGIVEFDFSAQAQMFALTYKSSSDRYYIVSQFDEYLLFQSEYSTFSTPFKTVKYSSEKEYFYVRYNRYLNAMYGDSEEYQEIGEDNVRYISAYVPMSTAIEKVNFFWIGTTDSSGVFTGTLPVIEIVYIDNTSSIAVIKDIVAEDIKSVVINPGPASSESKSE